MKVVIAIDSFKGSLSSDQLNEHITEGIKKIYPAAVVTSIPIADGGEGTVDALVTGTGGEFAECTVSNPVMQPITAKYGIMGDKKTAVIEMAAASGLPLIDVALRSPLKTTTYGTGELIKDAINRGCREFIIGIGGSATNDAELGMMQALGFKFFDSQDRELGQGGEIMSLVSRIDSSGAIAELDKCNFLIACDVDNPLFGERGAAFVYAPQKGASPDDVNTLDNGLRKLSETIKTQLNKDIAHLPGAGAAGGLGGGFVAFLNAQLKPGIEIILEKVQLEQAIEGADFVITGEGKIDEQSIMGKAPTGVSQLCAKKNIPVIAFAGCVADNAVATHDYGISAIFSIMNSPCSLETAMDPARASVLVSKNTEEVFRLIKVCQDKYTS